MRVKGYDDARAAEPLAHGAQLIEQRRMAAMDAVKISNSDRAS